MDKKYHFTYTIIDISSGEYYYGKHSTDNLNDGYMGSGNWTKENINNPNLIKVINNFYMTSDEAYIAEELLIGDLWIKDELCKNATKGGKLSFFEEGVYSEYCMKRWGVSHHMKSKEFLETFSFPFVSEDVQKKVDSTLRNKYGSRGSGSLVIKEKVEQTNIKRYGKKHTLHIDSVKNARETACIEKYGNINPFKNAKKLEEVLLERYGWKNPMDNPEIRQRHSLAMKNKDWTDRNEKSKVTNLEKYGVNNPMNRPEIKEKNKRVCPFGCKENHNYDAGNFSLHMIKVHAWTKEDIKRYKNEN